MLKSWLASCNAHALLHPKMFECECRYMGRAALVADATDPGQSGSSGASTSSKEFDTAATHFAGIM